MEQFKFILEIIQSSKTILLVLSLCFIVKLSAVIYNPELISIIKDMDSEVIDACKTLLLFGLGRAAIKN